MASRFKRNSKKINAEMNVVPYVDVMLVLLVIFMTTAPLLMQGIDVDLPTTTTKPIAQKTKPPMIVSIDKEGNYYLNISDSPKKPMHPQALALRVAAELKRESTRSVLVKGDKAVDYGAVVDLMALLQKSGAENVGLMTKEHA